MNKEKKQNYISEMTTQFDKSEAVIVAHYQGLTVKQFWPTVNNTISGLFHVFNVLTNNPSPYTSFDPTDYSSTLRCGGVMVLGVAKLKEFEDEQTVSNAIKSNLEKLAQNLYYQRLRCNF